MSESEDDGLQPHGYHNMDLRPTTVKATRECLKRAKTWMEKRAQIRRLRAAQRASQQRLVAAPVLDEEDEDEEQEQEASGDDDDEEQVNDDDEEEEQDHEDPRNSDSGDDYFGHEEREGEAYDDFPVYEVQRSPPNGYASSGEGSQDEPNVSSISDASDQVANALGQFLPVASSSNQTTTETDSDVVNINELPLYSEDNAPIKHKFIPEEPLPLQRELATIRVACEEEYARAAERFKVVDCAVTQTKKDSAQFQQYLTDERINHQQATTSSAGRATEALSHHPEADLEDVMMENSRKRKIDGERHVEQKRRRPLPFTIRKIDELVAKLEGEETQSLLKTHFTKNVVEMLKNRRTSMGATLFDCVRAGVCNMSSIGIYAPDAEAYSVFAPLFDNVVHDLHGFSSEQVHPPCNMIRVGAMVFPPLDPRGQFVKSTKISCRRSLNGFPFASRMTKEKYLELECKVKEGFEAFTGTPMGGVYHSLESLNKEQYKKMIGDQYLFRRETQLDEANALNFWPTGRGVYMNTSGNFRVCVNEQDHLRMESIEKGSDIGSAYNRLIEGVKGLETKLEFLRNDRLGFVTFCPTDLGCTIEATVSIRLPKLSVRTDFSQRCDELGLQVRGIQGNHWNGKPGILLLQNKNRVGKSEYDTVRMFHAAVKGLIEQERKTD